MKKIITALIIVFCLAGSYKAESQISTSINFNTFYTQLSPYGSWINNPDYGQVWIAHVNGFEPYSNNGYWEFTNYGWTWVSDYDWGWAPFHYGRWTYIPAYGWAWVPGYEWAPAWVSWCQYDGYYGWAPLSPGMGFNTGFGEIPYNNWRFVRYQYINNHNINHHFSRPAIQSNHYNNVTIINNTEVNNSITYATGPAQQEVERVTRKKIAPKQVSFSEELGPKTKVAANEIKLYRPDTKKNTADNVKPVTPVKQPPALSAGNKGENTGGVNPATVKQPVTKQTEPLQPVQVPVKQREQQTAPQKIQPVSPVQQDEISKQDQIRQQDEAADDDRNQVEIKRRQDESVRQQQLKNQQAVQQQKLQQQSEQRIQQARQSEQRKQQQEQMSQQKIQQQEMKRQEREQKALPAQQPSPAPKPSQPVKSEKKG
jgi:hypothetical protein